MAIQYKPTKPKKEKPVKAPKAPKLEKPTKMGNAIKVKPSKTAKPPKQPKAPKPEKIKAFTPTVQVGKVEKVDNLGKTNVLKKPVNFKIVGAVMVVLVAIAVLLLTVVLPAIERNGEQIQYIMVSQTPEKTVYFVGEEANYDGLRVLVTRNNGETFTVRASNCEITGFDSSEEKLSQTITVNYEGFTATFNVQIEEKPKVPPALAGIRLETLPKTEYKMGEWLDTTGGVILCEYVDGSVYRVALENSDVFGFASIDKPGEYTLTVKYIENGILATCEYTITVTE